jgi:hypothetical protein
MATKRNRDNLFWFAGLLFSLPPLLAHYANPFLAAK